MGRKAGESSRKGFVEAKRFCRGLPDLAQYDLAVHGLRIVDWMRHGHLKQWTKVEQDSIEASLKGIVWSNSRIPARISVHSLVGTTLKIFRTTYTGKERN